MSRREAFFTFFFTLRSEHNPFVPPMQIVRRRGDIYSPAGHKARLLFTSNLTQMSIGPVQRRCGGVRKDTVRLREPSKAPYVGPAMRSKPDISITTCSPDVGPWEEPQPGSDNALANFIMCRAKFLVLASLVTLKVTGWWNRRVPQAKGRKRGTKAFKSVLGCFKGAVALRGRR